MSRFAISDMDSQVNFIEGIYYSLIQP